MVDQPEMKDPPLWAKTGRAQRVVASGRPLCVSKLDFMTFGEDRSFESIRGHGPRERR
jgi:hypothetical protein